MAKDYLSMVNPSPADVEHFGVKGMKWGVRKAEKAQSQADRLQRHIDRKSGNASKSNIRKQAHLQQVADRRLQKQEKKDGSRGVVRRTATKANVALDAGAKVVAEGEKKLIFLPQKNRNKAASATQTRVLAEAVSINRSPQFKGKDLKGNTRLRNAYFKKLEEAAKTIYAEELDISRAQAWGEFFGVETNEVQMRMTVAANRIKHSDDGSDEEVLLEMNFETDDLGHVIKINVPEQYLTHDNLEGEDYLAHFGIKGMKWGVRKSSDSNGSTSSSSTTDHGNESSAQRYTRLLSQAKQKGGNSLTDEELRFVTQRGDAIARVNRLNEKKPGWVADAAKQVLQQAAKKQLKAVSESLSQKYITDPLINSKSD